jgi:hypothetical protein
MCFLDDLTDLFGVVNQAVVDHKDAPRAGIRVGEWKLREECQYIRVQKGRKAFNKFLKELNKSRRRDRAFNNVVCDDTVQRKDREDRVALAANEAALLNATLTNGSPPIHSVGSPFIVGGFVNEHEHVCIRDVISNLEHESRLMDVVSFKCACRDSFVGEEEAAKSATKCWKGKVETLLVSKHVLDFIEVEAVLVIQNCFDVADIGRVKGARTSR